MRGRTEREAARELGLSPSTVHQHLAAARRKLATETDQDLRGHDRRAVVRQGARDVDDIDPRRIAAVV